MHQDFVKKHVVNIYIYIYTYIYIYIYKQIFTDCRRSLRILSVKDSISPSANWD
jgi:hypothetical protein